MSYMTQSEMAEDYFMRNRVAAAAANEVDEDPDQWASEHRRAWAAAPGWDEAWVYAKLTHENDAAYEPGKDESVITDSMILAQVQAMVA